MNLGMPEMLLIFVIALMVFGPRKLPEIGRQLGKFMNEIKRTSDDFKQKLESEVDLVSQQEQQKKLAQEVPSQPADCEISSSTPPEIDTSVEHVADPAPAETTTPAAEVISMPLPDRDRLGIFRSSVSIEYLATTAAKVDSTCDAAEPQTTSSNA